MKRLIFLLLIALFSCSKQNPAEYNDSIIILQRKIVESIDNLKKVMDSYNTAEREESIKKIDEAYNNCFKVINESINSLQKMKPYGKDDTLRTAAIAMFKAYEEAISKYYKPIIEIYKIPPKMMTVEDHDKISENYKLASKRFDDIYEKFFAIQQRFAKRYNLKLE